MTTGSTLPSSSHPEPNLVLGDPFDHALEPLAPVNQLFQLDLRFVSGP